MTPIKDKRYGEMPLRNGPDNRILGLKVLVSEAGDVHGFSARQRYLEVRTEMGYPLDQLNDDEFGLRRMIRPIFVAAAGEYWTDVNPDEEIDSFDKRKSS